MSLRTWPLALALAALPAQESAAVEPPKESRQLSDASTYLHHMCRLEFDQAARSATNEGERELAALWAAAMNGEAELERERLDRVPETPITKNWKWMLEAHHAALGDIADVFPELSDGNRGVVGLGPKGTSSAAGRNWHGFPEILVEVNGKPWPVWMGLAPELPLSLVKQRVVRGVDLARKSDFSANGDLVLLDVGFGRASVRGTPVHLAEQRWFGVTGLLGWSFLSHFRWVVDLRGGRLRVRVLPSQDGPRNLVYVDEPVLQVTVNGQPALARLALTGRYTELTAYGAERLGIPLRRGGGYITLPAGRRITRGVKGTVTLAHEGAELPIQMARVSKQDPDFGVCVDVVIGHDMITRHRSMVLDGPAGFVKFGGDP